MTPYGSDYSDDQGFVILGDIGAIHLPFNLTEEEAERYARELREREARKRPMGFQAVWPEDEKHLRIA